MQQLTPTERWNRLREAAGYKSNSALERALDISQAQIYRWVAWRRDPALTVLKKMAGLLKVSLDDLVALLEDLRNEHGAKAQSDTTA